MNLSMISVAVGMLLSIIYVVSALIVIRIAMKRDDWKSFVKLVFGSMTIRLLVTLVIIWLAVSYFDIKVFEFLLTVFLTIFVMIFIEIAYLNKKASSIKLKK